MTSHHEKRELLRLSRNGHIVRLRKLLERNVDINFLHHKTGMTPLMTAAYAGQANAVKLLLDFNASPHLRADDNVSAFHWACLKGDLPIVSMLLDAGADPNVRRMTVGNDEDGPAPIHMALHKNANESVANALINAGASLDVKYFGRTVVEYAEWHQCLAVVRYLPQRGIRR